MNRFLCRALAVLAVAGCATGGPASAAVIFSDDFNRANSALVGNGWTENEGGSLAISITSNRVQFKGHDSGDTPDGFLAQLTINTAGFATIRLDYDWGATDAEPADDQLLVQWKLNSSATWITLGTHALDEQAVAAALQTALPSSADNALIDLRFAVNVNMGNDTAFLDNVVLSGTARVVEQQLTSVPEPGTLALLGAGLAGLGLMRRKRRTA